MGVLPKNRKNKFNKSGAPNLNNIKVNAEMIQITNENDVSQAKTKKVKNNKISVVPTESKIDNDTIEVEAKKNKIVEMPADDENVVKAKPKKMKFVEMSNETSESDFGKPKSKKSKMNKLSKKPSNELENEEGNTVVKKVKTNEGAVESSGNAEGKGLTEELMAQYPILKDQAMITKLQAVTLTNNKKGCLRQQLRQQLKGTSGVLLPDAINTKIQALLKTDNPNLMKLRILFNMLKTVLLGPKIPVKKEKLQPVKKQKKQKQKKEENGPDEESDGEDKKTEQKVKGPKRYVVFIGNLALDISKEKILEHFSDLSDKIKDVRIPNPLPNKKSTIAYLEVEDEVTYELALSKHHSMLDNKRINVLYSTQKNSKISKAEAKGKAAKLVAMQKSGKLAGSEPQSKKRSARRRKMKLAQKKVQEAAERGV